MQCGRVLRNPNSLRYPNGTPTMTTDDRLPRAFDDPKVVAAFAALDRTCGPSGRFTNYADQKVMTALSDALMSTQGHVPKGLLGMLKSVPGHDAPDADSPDSEKPRACRDEHELKARADEIFDAYQALLDSLEPHQPSAEYLAEADASNAAAVARCEDGLLRQFLASSPVATAEAAAGKVFYFVPGSGGYWVAGPAHLETTRDLANTLYDLACTRADDLYERIKKM